MLVSKLLAATMIAGAVSPRDGSQPARAATVPQSHEAGAAVSAAPGERSLRRKRRRRGRTARAPVHH